jgi:chromosome segregation ATPase
MMEKLENLETRVTALEAGRNSRLDAMATVLAETRRDVSEIKTTMVVRDDLQVTNDRLDVLAEVSTGTRVAVHRVEQGQKELGSKFLALQADMTGFKTNVLRLNADVAMLKVGVSGLQVDVSEMKVDIATLKGDVATLKGDVSELKGDVSELKGDVSELKGGVSQILTLVTQLVANSASSAK